MCDREIFKNVDKYSRYVETKTEITETASLRLAVATDAILAFSESHVLHDQGLGKG